MSSFLGNIPEKFLLGYMVLNASKTPEFPFVSADVEANQHVEGAVNGTVFCAATEQQPFYYPQRGRSYTLFSVQNYGESEHTREAMLNFANLHDKNEADASFHASLDANFYPSVLDNSLLMIEQHRPFGMVSLISKGVDLYMYGLHTESQSLLVWTNLESFEDLLQKEYGNKYWLYRFRVRRNLSTVIFTKRVCSRWYRWSQEANFKSPAARFPALENSLFKPTFKPLENV